MKTAAEFMERRKHPRFAKAIDVHLRPPSREALVARSIDLSRNGAYCRVSEPIPVMTNLQVVFELPPGGRRKAADHVECQGVVVFQKGRVLAEYRALARLIHVRLHFGHAIFSGEDENVIQHL